MAKRRESPVRKEHIEESMCSPDLARNLIRGLPFFSEVPESEFPAIYARFRDVGFLPEERIYREGDPAGTLYTVAAGKVRLVRYTDEGVPVLLDLLGSGEFAGTLVLQPGALYRENAIAHTECCILTIKTSEFREIASRLPQVALACMELLAERTARLEERVHALSTASAGKRIASALGMLAKKFGERRRHGLLLQVQVSREDLAALSGTTVETASRVMSRLREQGVIESGRRWIGILKPDALDEFGD
jgi:CRP-like cAMP-binding protein